MWSASCLAIAVMSCRLTLMETVVSAAPKKTALTEPEKDPLAATSRRTLKLTSLILIRPLRPSLAMSLKACRPTDWAASTPLKATSAAVSTPRAAVTAASSGTKAAFAASSVLLVAFTASSATINDASMGFLRARQAAFAVSQAGSGILVQQLFHDGR